MTYLFVEMILFLLAALALGVLLGWMVWGWRSRSGSEALLDPGAARMTADLEAGRSELSRLRGELAAMDTARKDAEARALAFSAQLKTGPAAGAAPVDDAQVSTLQTRVRELEAALASLRSAPTPVSVDASAATPVAAPIASPAASLADELERAQNRAAAAESALRDLRRAAPAPTAAPEPAAAPAMTKPASLVDELERAQTRASSAEKALRDLRRSAAAAAKAETEHAALQKHVDQLQDDLADARRRADEAAEAESSREAARTELEQLKAAAERDAVTRQTLIADLEQAQLRVGEAEQELAALKAAAAEADAEVGATAPPAPLASATPEAPAAPAPASEPPADPDAVGDQPTLLDAPRDTGKDDLKRIKGVGPKLEEILNDLGVYHYDQIAGWTEREIAWVDARLRFRGRVTRDGWIDQATKLAAGEDTDFSKKVDKGDVYD